MLSGATVLYMSKHALLKIALTCLILMSLSCGNQVKPVPRQVLKEAQNSVFVVEGLACGKGSVGLGVLIEEGILTNAHVIAGTEKLEVIDFNGGRSTTYPINADFKTDLALLKGPDLAVTPLQVAEPKENQRGSILVGSQGLVETIPVTLLRLLNIVIADIDETVPNNQPAISSPNAFTSPENQAAVGAVTVNDADNDVINYSRWNFSILEYCFINF